MSDTKQFKNSITRASNEDLPTPATMVNGHHHSNTNICNRNSDIPDNNDNDEPINEKVWLYEENIKRLYNLDDNPDRKPFLDEFFEYRRKHGLYSKIPVIARKPLDIFVLYFIVQKYGGFEQTMKNRMWSQIARELDLPRTMTSGAFTLKLKYIRLLYQFECFKCQKAINHSILYNESALMDTKDLLSDKNDDVQYMRHSRSSESLDEKRERDYRTIQEIEYRKSLTRTRSSPPNDAEYSHMRHNEPKHRYDYPMGRESPVSSDGIFDDSDSSPRRDIRHYKDSTVPVSRYPNYNMEVHRPLKRKYSDEDLVRYEDERRERNSSNRSGTGNNLRSITQLSVDLLEILDDKLIIKVRVNNARYEGVLQTSI